MHSLLRLWTPWWASSTCTCLQQVITRLAHGTHSDLSIHLLGLECEAASSCSHEHLVSSCWQFGEAGKGFAHGVQMVDTIGI